MPRTLQKFQDKRLRNLLRGAQSNTKSPARRRTINNARSILSLSDATAFATAMCETELDESFFGPAFPNSVTTIHRVPHRKYTSLEIECAIQRARLFHNLERLNGASVTLGLMNSAILSGNLMEARQLCMDLLDQFGYSATLARKIIYITLLATNHPKTIETLDTQAENDDLLQHFFSKGSSRHYAQFMNLTIDICDKDVDCFETMRDHMKFLNESLVTSTRFPPNYAMMRRILFPANFSSIINPVSLLYFSSSSAIDLLVDLCTASHCSMNSSRVLQELFSTRSFLCLKSNLQPRKSSLAEFIQLPHAQAPEQAAYRASSIFTEVKEFANWRRAIDYEFYIREAPQLPTERGSSTFFPNNLQLADLCEQPSIAHFSFEKFDNSAASSFLRTVAVLNCLRSGSRLTDLNSEDMRILLSQTTGFSRLLHKHELVDLKNHSKEENADIIVFLTMVMLNEKEPSEDLAFEMRMAFQMVVLRSHNADIVSFLNWLSKRTENLCPVVVELCDISFLERLYLINSSYSEVLESRERICRWMATTFGVQDYEAIADRLALDAKVRTIRRGIDEARIFVDVLRYKQWSLDALAPILRKFERVISVADTGLEEVSLPTRKKAMSKDAPVASLDFWFYAASEKAFSEFCHNKLFGIDSYLSRRIRHGTLSGTLVVPIQEKITEFQDSHCSPLTPDYQCVNAVLQEYQNIVTLIRDELLHFRTKEKPTGLFVVGAGRTKTRASIQADFRNRIVDLFNEGYSASEVSPLFLDHCWSLLTEDLYRIQETLRTILPLRCAQSCGALPMGKGMLPGSLSPRT